MENHDDKMTESSRTILVIDDDQAIRETLHELLEQEGYTVFCAENGEDGLRMLSRIRAPALILLDQNMPVMNGAEFLRFKQLDDRFARIPVVVMSAERCRFGEGQVAEFLAKPFNVGKLLRTAKHYSSIYSGQRIPALEPG